MTRDGSNVAPWSWLHRVAVPALVVGAEATWVSLLVDAAVDTNRGGVHPDLPMLAFALPAIAAALLAAWTGRTARPRLYRLAVLLPLALVGAAFTAACVASLTTSGVWLTAATHPWAASGHVAGVAVGAGWFAATVAWLRGLSVGYAAPPFGPTIWSLALGGIAFIGIFAGRTDSHAHPFHAATNGAGPLLFLFFPLMSTALALIYERALETSALHGARSHLGSAWLTVLAVPMLIVALIALLLGALIGPAAPLLGKGIGGGVGAIGRGVAAATRWLLHLIGLNHGKAKPIPVGDRGGGGPASSHGSGTPLGVLAILVGAAFIVMLIYLVKERSSRGAPRSLTPAVRGRRSETEVTESLFTWQHVLAQLTAALRRAWARLLERFRGRRATGSAGAARRVGAEHTVDDDSQVRAAYRRVLAAARAAGQGRQPTETSEELGKRLAEDLPEEVVPALAALTDSYQAVRYGDSEGHEAAARQAAAVSEALSAAATRRRDEREARRAELAARPRSKRPARR